MYIQCTGSVTQLLEYHYQFEAFGFSWISSQILEVRILFEFLCARYFKIKDLFVPVSRYTAISLPTVLFFVQTSYLNTSWNDKEFIQTRFQYKNSIGIIEHILYITFEFSYKFLISHGTLKQYNVLFFRLFESNSESLFDLIITIFFHALEI